MSRVDESYKAEVNKEAFELLLSFSSFLGSIVCLVRPALILLNVFCAVERSRSVGGVRILHSSEFDSVLFSLCVATVGGIKTFLKV